MLIKDRSRTNATLRFVIIDRAGNNKCQTRDCAIDKARKHEGRYEGFGTKWFDVDFRSVNLSVLLEKRWLWGFRFGILLLLTTRCYR